ncbi:Uncharacterized protein TPAR_04550 [Tolypocladium paradoxum]|uniref:Uncharacterized protein n=1 Tax=Tolypocladium paradoxum TaxID=94208 RepID=A0A2S4KYK3_9HYPO|nr:Uncharacterized protein TPAR_04550 [Tolypocladium paradoxum]
MTWSLREREMESSRYSHRSYGYVPVYEDRCSRRRRRSSACDDPRRFSYTTTYGTYIYPFPETILGRGTSDLADGASKYCPQTSEGDSTPPCSCGCGGRRKSSWTYRPARRASFRADDSSTKSRTVIDVVDRTGGPLSLRHGAQFPVSLSPHATADDIISMLAPDRRRHKVVVKWRDGDYEDLDEMIQIDEIRRYAKRLDVKERKRVRWA